MNVEQMWLLVGSVGSVALCTTATQLLHIGGTNEALVRACGMPLVRTIHVVCCVWLGVVYVGAACACCVL